MRPAADPPARAWWHSPARVLGLFALWLLATPWLRPLLLPDEGRYSEVAREMMVGDWLTPTLAGLPFFHKPPLTYWINAAAMQIFGVGHFAVRMAPALGAWMMGASLWFALRRWHDVRTAGAGLVLLASAPFCFAGAQYANHDMLVAGLVVAATFAFARAVLNGAPERRWLLVAWSACGGAVMAKGLIGLVLPAITIGPWLLVQGRWRDLLRMLHPLPVAAFALVVLPWHLWMERCYPGFFDYYVVGQHFRRYTSAGFNNPQPWYFYLVVLPILVLPWSLWLLPLLRRVRPARWWAARGSTTALLAWWMCVVLLFFSLPASKLIGYILPAIAPLCALLAPQLARRSRLWPIALPSAVACVVLIGYVAWKSPNSARDIAPTLAAQRAPGDIVVFVDEPFNDLRFDARLDDALVASNWDDPAIPRFDNWRKELYDGVRFDPSRGREILWPLARLAELTCRGRTVWLVARPGSKPLLVAVPGAAEVQAGRNALLWRAAARPC